MKILIVHRYFWPDQANCGQILFAVAQQYQSKGYQVEVLTSLPSRNFNSNKIIAEKFEIYKKIKIYRINLSYETGKPIVKIVNSIKIGLMTNILVLRNKYDFLISTSVPPILGGFFSAIACIIKKVKFIYFCMDLYPEVGKLSGDFSNPIIYKLFEKIDNWNCKKASRIIVHSEDMKKILESRIGKKNIKIDIINNFSVPSDLILKPRNIIKDKKKNELIIIFVGNIGRFQDLEIIIDAMSLIKTRDDIKLIIIGEGAEKKNLIERAKKNKANITFFDYQSIDVVKKAILKSDIGLVTLKHNLYKYAYPGKLMTYLEQGRPIISTLEPKSNFIRTMKQEGYGFYVPRSINKISKLFISLANDKSWKLKMNNNAKKANKKLFSKKKILAKWIKILEY
jgi:glycosyltransferase involved in cell wall biosynthesis